MDVKSLHVQSVACPRMRTLVLQTIDFQSIVVDFAFIPVSLLEFIRQNPSFACLKLLEDPRIDKTMIGFVADDEMIDHFDFEKFSRLNKVIGEILIFD